jgi:hypothetical protein
VADFGWEFLLLKKTERKKMVLFPNYFLKEAKKFIETPPHKKKGKKIAGKKHVLPLFSQKNSLSKVNKLATKREMTNTSSTGFFFSIFGEIWENQEFVKLWGGEV